MFKYELSLSHDTFVTMLSDIEMVTMVSGPFSRTIHVLAQVVILSFGGLDRACTFLRVKYLLNICYTLGNKRAM